MSIELSHPVDVPTHALEAIQADSLLPVCVACGTQYPSERDACRICDDPRQAVPPSGQAWTSLGVLVPKHRHTIVPDEDDDRVEFINTEPAFAINQTPIHLRTANGSYLWDCAALITTALVAHLTAHPLKAIAISHPHFFSTSLTWSRALRVPLYLNEADKEWYQRAEDISDSDQVVWWRDEVELGPGVRIIECGGHFPGSSVLHWDRLLEPAPDDRSSTRHPVSGLLLTADTIMVQGHRKGFTFIWSVPNNVPLSPQATLAIQRRLKSIPFGQATSSWPGRFIRDRAREVLAESVDAHLAAMGWARRGDDLIPATESGPESVAAASPKQASETPTSEEDLSAEAGGYSRRPGVIVSGLWPR